MHDQIVTSDFYLELDSAGPCDLNIIATCDWDDDRFRTNSDLQNLRMNGQVLGITELERVMLVFLKYMELEND